MDPNTRPTLGEVIAAGHRLLTATPTVATVPPAVPSPREHHDWRTAAEIAPLVRLAPWTVAEHLRNGTLHGHADAGRWSVRDGVADAFLDGVGPAGQRRVCGCRPLRVVEGAGEAAVGPTARRCSRRALRVL